MLDIYYKHLSGIKYQDGKYKYILDIFIYYFITLQNYIFYFQKVATRKQSRHLLYHPRDTKLLLGYTAPFFLTVSYFETLLW